MLKKISLIVSLSFLLFTPFFALAQVDELVLEEDVVEEEEVKLEPKITSEDFVKVDKKVIFSASDSTLLEEEAGLPIYNWEFGDGFYDSGEEVVHQYTRTGRYTVNLAITQGTSTEKVGKDIFVFDKKALLVTDQEKEEEFDLLIEQAGESGVALKLLSVVEEGAFLTEDKAAQAMKDLRDYIKDSDSLIFYTKSSLGLQAFSRYFQDLSEDEKQVLRKKFFVKLTDRSMDVAANFSYQAFKIIKPNFILLSRPEALSPMLTVKDYAELPDILDGRGIEYKIIDERGEKSSAFVLSHLITLFISKGVSPSAAYLILVIPFLTFVTVFFRQVIGLSTFGVYAPVIVAASFFILGLGFGIVAFLFAVVTSYLVKYVLNKLDLLYLPKVALNLTFIALSFLIVIWLALIFDVPISFSLAIFPLLVMSTVSEKFMAAQSEEGFKNALFSVGETLIIVIISYYLITWTLFNNWVMSWPELVLIPILLNLLLGKFTGLRLGEYLRFRSLFSDHTEE